MSSTSLNLRQKQHLEALISRFNHRTNKSKSFAQTYRPYLADNKVLSRFDLLTKEMYYPIVSERSLGSKIWDVNNNEYIDFIMGYGTNLFGHNPLFIKQALLEQLEKGIQLGTQPELIGEVAEGIYELTGLERVAFSNTGTEAVMTAIRLARTVTGRDKIVIFSGSYHGHFDESLVEVNGKNGSAKIVPISPGIPANFATNVLILDYGNAQSLEVIKQNAQQIAAVLVEPVQSRRPDLQPKEFLQQLRQLTLELGITLIFDEMVTGFRIHSGGAQAHFGVKADLATYGKIIGGGMPISIIAGKSDYLNTIDGGTWNYGDLSYPQVKTTFFAGTFCKHPLAIAAAGAVIKHLKKETALHMQLNERTSKFVNRLNHYFEKEELPVRMVNFGSLFGRAYAGNSTSAEANASSLSFELLYYQLLDRGILLRGDGGFLSTAHTDEDIDYVLSAVKDSVEELRKGEFLPTKSHQTTQENFETTTVALS
ncbi:polyketide synthase [Dulcicalothrix desertica PCC 7102]|uniref:Polyketide synthase n=1 Tax=Dulcicalothrix desertica PCC 7102 TaxID=232991 RepID=A0A3S1CIT4_9CYAN|nr:aspartate aminotransferase family protein [Dulcicalothrix desertica]RUT04341.1 polyketide synthase [Dulcicalothrix desertica PCC 7102]TWH51196.1 glutamate-1-semialdehyde-2,1-aminomutase [Dulcicalothrix desertica PCC 7102]